MSKFDELYSSILNEVKASPSNFSGNPVKPVGNFANSPIPKGYDAIQNTINQKLAAKDKWFEKYIPYGYRNTSKYELGTTEDGRDFVTWIVPNEGEMTYDYYVVYKDEGKEHWIDEDEYRALSK